jgi:hypothetical protein
MLVGTLKTVEMFKSSAVSKTSVRSLKMSEELVGASIEVNGGKVYDPLGLLKIHDINPGVLPHPKWLRESEIKHSRIAMLASIGAFTGQYGLVIPGYIADPDPVTNLNKFVTDFPLGFAQIIFAIALVEGASDPSQFWFGKGKILRVRFD